MYLYYSASDDASNGHAVYKFASLTGKDEADWEASTVKVSFAQKEYIFPAKLESLGFPPDTVYVGEGEYFFSRRLPSLRKRASSPANVEFSDLEG